MEDNFYQASSENPFPISKEAVQREQRAKMAYEKEAPIISETIGRLKKQIEFYQSVSSIKTKDDPEKFMREVAVNAEIAKILDKEVKRLERMVKTYGKDSRE